MHWLDVCGPPGSGKSTLCDPLWGPHDIAISGDLPPLEWHDFLNEITRLMTLIQRHPTLEAVIRMNNRSVRKIATVARLQRDDTYVQTALVQRGLGFGWRMADMGIPMKELSHYFRLMPVSVGVVFTKCDETENIKRNHDREKIKATAHENRDFMVPLMKPAIEVAKDEFRKRGVPVWEISTENDPEFGRDCLRKCADLKPFDASQGGPGSKVQVLSPPFWWR